MANEYDYDSYGRPSIIAEAVEQPYMYTGREYDRATGLYYYRARYYDPETGTFTQDDPIHFAAGDLNVSRYVGSNPVNWNDSSGLVIAAEYGGTDFTDEATKAGAFGVGLIVGCILTEASGYVKGAVTVGLGGEYIRTSPCMVAAVIDPSRALPGDTPIAPITTLPIAATQTCSNRTKRDLKNRQNKACNRKRSCQGLNSADHSSEILRNIVRNQECMAARMAVMNICFGGGDQRHARVVEDVKEVLKQCQGL